jgi:hypothetical protein
MKHILLGALAIILIAFAIYYYSPTAIAPPLNDYKNTSYLIDGMQVTLMNGVAEIEAAPGSATKTIVRYFGNELKTDLNGDGREDVAFILTKEGGGSGIFFYAVAALNTETGYVGSDGYLLGDRVAPQNPTLSPNPKHADVVVFNYAERAQGEPMTAQPAVNKSAYLKLDTETMRWGVVEPDFEGETAWECNADAFICPDGSLVGRTGPKCEFTSCPSLLATSAKLQTYLGGRVTGLNLTLNPREIVSDSRCPKDVQCIWAGTVEVRTAVETKVAHGEHVFKLNEPLTIGDFTVTLVEVRPEKTEEAIPVSSYWFVFDVQKTSVI